MSTRGDGRACPALAISILVALALAGCAAAPRIERPPQTGLARLPDIATDPGTGEHALEIDVLTYNVAGLPWPVRGGRGEALRRIGDYLGELREAGREPDIVLVQEGFISEIADLVAASGYPNHVHGPLAGDRAPPLDNGLADDYRRKAFRLRGEGLGKWLGSGLHVLSNFPILEFAVRPFRYCAGLDCLANKGAVLARIEVPGLPVPLDVVNTHLNARGAAKVPRDRTLLAHNLQIEELAAFLDDARGPGYPLIFGGDFNTRNAEDRIDYALGHADGMMIASYYCTRLAEDCDIRLSFDGDQPWLDTQDLLGFSDGAAVRVRPVAIEAMFDCDATGGVLSDHDGYLVRYRLSWQSPEIARTP